MALPASSPGITAADASQTAAAAPPSSAPVTPAPIASRFAGNGGAVRVVSGKPADLTCLAKAVYYEARGESADGQAAVAQVVLNRTHRASYPSNVCAVVFQGVNRGGCQFSFACNGAMNRPIEPVAWSRARRVAANALGGHVMTAVGQAVSFHVGSFASESSGAIARIGSHVFFMPGRGRASSPTHLLRIAGGQGAVETQEPALAATVAAAAHDAAAAVPEVVASNSQSTTPAAAQ